MYLFRLLVLALTAQHTRLEVELFEHNRSGSKRFSKGSRPTSMKGVNGDLLSTALVDGQAVEGEGEPSSRTAGIGLLAAL
jgi:hypothetical protein